MEKLNFNQMKIKTTVSIMALMNFMEPMKIQITMIESIQIKERAIMTKLIHNNKIMIELIHNLIMIELTQQNDSNHSILKLKYY